MVRMERKLFSAVWPVVANRVKRTRRCEEHKGFSVFTLWPTKWQSSFLPVRFASTFSHGTFCRVPSCARTLLSQGRDVIVRGS